MGNFQNFTQNDLFWKSILREYTFCPLFPSFLPPPPLAAAIKSILGILAPPERGSRNGLAIVMVKYGEVKVSNLVVLPVTINVKGDVVRCFMANRFCLKFYL